MVSFCERYHYSIQMACPYRPCLLSKGLHHPYWCGLVIIGGVCSASRHWCSSQIACPYFQCHSSKGFHHRYLDPLVGHRDNHTELRPEMVSFCERYRYSTQMACPYRPCHLSKGLDHPYSYALDRKSRRTRPSIVSFYEKRATRQRETSCSSWVFSSR